MTGLKVVTGEWMSKHVDAYEHGDNNEKPTERKLSTKVPMGL